LTLLIEAKYIREMAASNFRAPTSNKRAMKKHTIIFIAFCLFVAAGSVFGQNSVFNDNKAGFSVSYPAGWSINKKKNAATETAFGDPGNGTKLVRFVPKNIDAKYHGTYEFNVWRSTKKGVVCSKPTGDAQDVTSSPAPSGWKETINIGGHTFYGYSGGEGGMSKSLNLLGYRGEVNGQCWQIQAMSYQVSAYDDFEPFDDDAILAEFCKFLGSFKFTSTK
jgi:hypothetical protein